jgi:hypothetical protein
MTFSKGLVLGAMIVVVALDAEAARTFSLHPAPVYPGQPAFVRIDDNDGCYEFDEHRVTRTGNVVNVEILASDHPVQPCLPQNVTPIFLPLGSFETGIHFVDVTVLCFAPVNPCSRTLLTLDVGGMARRKTIPALGWIGLLLSASGVLALAVVRRRDTTAA